MHMYMYMSYVVYIESIDHTRTMKSRYTIFTGDLYSWRDTGIL